MPHVWDSMLNTPLVMLAFISFYDFKEDFSPKILFDFCRA